MSERDKEFTIQHTIKTSLIYKKGDVSPTFSFNITGNTYEEKDSGPGAFNAMQVDRSFTGVAAISLSAIFGAALDTILRTISAEEEEDALLAAEAATKGRLDA